MAEASASTDFARVKDISGQRFGRWMAVRPVKRLPRRRTAWECVCDCGTIKVISSESLTRGESRSCGCLRAEETGNRFRGVKHDFRKPRSGCKNGASIKNKTEYNALRDAVRRCSNPSNKYYHRYGGRGIYVCDRWLHGEDGSSGVECFLKDIGERPAKGLSLDRIDNNGPYAPWNCRWTDWKTQRHNQG